MRQWHQGKEGFMKVTRIHKILVGERSGKKYIEAISRILDIEIAA